MGGPQQDGVRPPPALTWAPALTGTTERRQHLVVNETADANSTSSEPGDEAAVPTRLLVLGMAHRDGSIDSGELYAVSDAVGLSSDQVRSCLRRLVSEGLFDRRGEGRDARYLATDEARARPEPGGQRPLRADGRDGGGGGGPRRWRLVGFAVPERRRTARDRFRDWLLALGAASIHNGLYVSPHRWDAEVAEEAQRLGIADHVTMASTDDLAVGGEANPRELAATLWPLDEVAQRYRAFIAAYREVPDSLDAMRRRGERLLEKDFLPGALHIAIAFNRCFELDPLLPPELLPKPWPGREAREILARCRKLGVLAREDKAGPALFQVFDDAIASLP